MKKNSLFKITKKGLLFFIFFAFLLFVLKKVEFSNNILTDRKIVYILSFLFFVIFKVESRVIIGLGLLCLLGIIAISYSNNFLLVNRLAIYAWGFFLLGIILQTLEIFFKKNEKK